MSKKETRFETSPLTSEGSILATVITDKETGVQYLLATQANMGSGLCMLVDAQGKPRLAKQS